jgi:acylphosphatase
LFDSWETHRSKNEHRILRKLFIIASQHASGYSMPRIHLKISGRVQGVFFRGSAVDKALSLGLTGWAKNLSTGEVEVVAEGAEEALEKLVAWCYQGPPMARVINVEISREPETGECKSFSIAY